ncbi:MAG TPA: hypothetical protein DCS63_07785 [Elusimicrobia bacterium]|nr:hypothetical protein [Elusimicrobiota bacterium]
MSVMPKLKAAYFFFLTLACAAALPAQEAGDGAGQDYQKMMQQMLKSGNYEQNQPESWDARLKVVSGGVMVRPSGAEDWSRVTGEMPLDPDDSVKTAPDGVAELYLDDKGAIYVGRNTQLEISSLDQGNAVFFLDSGAIVAKVKRLLNDKFKMQVRTPAAVCAVRGTEFAVEHSQFGKETTVAVFDEGSLAVTQAEADEGAGQEYVLEKNMELSLGPEKKRLRPVRLSRMTRHKGALGAVRARLAALKSWRPRSPARRAALREQALKRRVIRRQVRDGARPKAGRPRSSKAAAARRAKERRQAREDSLQDSETELGRE